MDIRIAVIIPTHNRPHLLANRAIASVSAQTRKPDYLLVVDDSDKKFRKLNKEIVATRKVGEKTGTHYLENYRTKGACGAWNTALAHLLYLTKPNERDNCYIALLDDDDSWEASYLERCAKAAELEKADTVIARFTRIENSGNTLQLIEKEHLTPNVFLVENPGWQGSNTFVRFSTLLEAGCFDENQTSTNDRDLAIRLLDLPNIKCEIISEPLIKHCADSNRERLSTPGSIAKSSGAQTFFEKYSCRMTADQKKAYKQRAEKLFKVAIVDEPTPSKTNCEKSNGLNAPGTPPSLNCLLIGCIAAKNIDIPKGFVESVADLAKQAPQTEIHALLLANGFTGKNKEWHFLDACCKKASNEQCTFMLKPSGETGYLSIAEARTALQKECHRYLEMNNMPEDVPVWILDDDARFDIPTFGENGPEIMPRLNHIALIEELSKTGADIIIGSVYGEPPLPFVSTLRVQLLDLFYNLQRMNNMALQRQANLDARYCYNFEHNQLCRKKYDDFYYDLSRRDTGQLEVPFWYEPKGVGLSLAGAFSEMVSRLDGLFAGRQVFRNLLWTRENLPETLLPKFTRGPNTLVFKRSALKDIPNIAPKIDGKYTRRSDMNWALLCHFAEGLRVEMSSFPIRQDRSAVQVKHELEFNTFFQDVRGYAIHSALYDTLMSARAKNLETNNSEDGLQVLDYSGERLGEALRLTKKYLGERMKAFEMNRYRIVGLLKAITRLCQSECFWVNNPRFSEEQENLQKFLEHIKKACFEDMESAVDEAKNIADEDILRFFIDLRCHVALSRGSLYVD